MDPKFRQERQDALNEIREAFTKRIHDLALQNNITDTGTMPDYARIQEMFRWPSTILYIVEDLEKSRPLKEVFSRVSVRYESQTALGLAEDIYLSPQTAADGRGRAFEEVLKALDVAARDFDISYQPLSRDMLSYWQKKHPIAAEHLELAWKENLRHFMGVAIAESRAVIENLRDHPPTPPGPQPHWPTVGP